MKVRSINTLLVIAGMLGIGGAFWSGSGADSGNTKISLLSKAGRKPFKS
jgi:hypothetical protein